MDDVNSWFTPVHYILYLGIPFIGMILWYMRKWDKESRENIWVLIVRQAGGGDKVLVPKVGGSVKMENPHTGTMRVWPINELTTIEQDYPGDAFIPKLFQKKIQMAILHEGDWEPLLNRSPHRTKVASPDIATLLERIKNDPETPESVREDVAEMLDGIATAPTRDIIASPAVLGNLIEEKVSELAITISKDIMEPIEKALALLGKPIKPLIVYIGLGLLIIMVGIMIYQGMETPDLTQIAEDMQKVKDALGVR